MKILALSPHSYDAFILGPVFPWGSVLGLSRVPPLEVLPLLPLCPALS